MPDAFLLLPGDYSHAASPDLPAPGESRILFVESERFLHGAHHRQKLVLHLAAAQRFARELEAEGHDVQVLRSQSLAAALAEGAVGRATLRVQSPATRPLERAVHEGAKAAGVALEALPEKRFIATRERFAGWAKTQEGPLGVDAWYRELRIETGALMEPHGATKRRKSKADAAFKEADDKAKAADLQPLTGRWIPSARKDPLPEREAWLAGWPEVEASDEDRRVVEEALAEVRDLPDAIGAAEPFQWPVSREGALADLARFTREALPYYHKMEDAMLSGHPLLYHARLSPALNLGLLHPGEIVERLGQAVREEDAPPGAAEAVLRNVLGWREFCHGFYWHAGEKYQEQNHFGHERKLPDFFDNPDYTSMNCLKQAVQNTLDRGYAPPHHRLMVLANVATLLEIEPKQFASWCERAFVDGVEWAAWPNAFGLGTFADGGAFTPKPYVTAAAYVNKHSDYCHGCGYDPEARAERRACPLNYLYWHFVAGKEPLLKGNPKMSVAYRILGEFGDDAREQARARAEEFFQGLLPAEDAPEGAY